MSSPNEGAAWSLSRDIGHVPATPAFDVGLCHLRAFLSSYFLSLDDGCNPFYDPSLGRSAHSSAYAACIAACDASL